MANIVLTILHYVNSNPPWRICSVWPRGVIRNVCRTSCSKTFHSVWERGQTLMMGSPSFLPKLQVSSLSSSCTQVLGVHCKGKCCELYLRPQYVDHYASLECYGASMSKQYSTLWHWIVILSKYCSVLCEYQGFQLDCPPSLVEPYIRLDLLLTVPASG